MRKILINVVGEKHYHGKDVFKIGRNVTLRVEEGNDFDVEAIAVEMENLGKVGSVANSVITRPHGCHSAGFIWNFVKKSYYVMGKVVAISKDLIMVEVEINE